MTPYVRFAMHDTINKRWKLSRSIWDYEIIYIAEGSMIIETESNRYVAKKDDIVFLRPDVHHVLRSGSDSTSQPHVHFDFFKDELSEKIPVSLKTKKNMSAEEKSYFRHDDLHAMGVDFPVVMSLHDHIVIRTLLYRIIDEYRLKMIDSEAYMAALLTEMIITIRRSYNASKSDISFAHITAFEKIKRYILDNIDRAVSVDELSRFIFLSKYHFIRVFTEHFNETPHRYITRLRVERAKELLLYDNSLTVFDVAAKMDFDSQQTFSAWFKKNVGVSPLKYRQSAK